MSRSKSLANRKLGTFIDSHDIVLRFATAINGTQQLDHVDSGYKTTHLWLNCELQREHILRSHALLNFYKNLTHTLVFKACGCEISNLIWKAFKNGLIVRKGIWNQDLIVHPKYQLIAQKFVRYTSPSSGVLAIFMMLDLCDKVNVFGFSSYVKQDYGNNTNHDMHLEHRMLKILVFKEPEKFNIID